MWNDTYYGGYRTRTFQEVFNSADEFLTFLNEDCDIPLKITNESATTLYYLLYAAYANRHVVMSDENRFKYSVASTIFMYGPSWEKRLAIQDDIRKLTLDELRRGSKDIYNTALNPGTEPTTDTLEELPAINAQNTTNRKKSILEGYGALLALLETDVTKSFVDKFNKLFIKILEPDYPLLYEFQDTEV